MSAPPVLHEAQEEPAPLRTLWLLALLAAAVRLAFLALEPPTRPVGDELTWIGWSIQSPAGVASPEVRFSPFKTGVLFYPPGYPYFVGALFALFGSLAAVKAVQCLVGALLVPAVGLVAWRVGGPAVGRAAGWIAALYPELIWFAAHFWSETLFLTLLWWALERALAADACRSLRLAVWAGLLWGLAVLTRETVLYFTPLLALFLLGRHPERGSLKRAAAFALIALVSVSSWTLRNWTVYQAFIPVSTAGGLNLWQGNARLTRQEVYDRYFAVPGVVAQYQHARAMGLAAIRERQPGWIFEKLVEQLPLFFEADNLALVHIGRGGYGEVGAAARAAVALVTLAPYLLLLSGFVAGAALVPLSRGRVLLLVFLAYYTLIHVATHGFARYRMPVLPVLFVLAAGALVAWRGGTLRREPRRLALALLLGLTLSAALWPSLGEWLGGSAARSGEGG